jgi:hypothetical protein
MLKGWGKWFLLAALAAYVVWIHWWASSGYILDGEICRDPERHQECDHYNLIFYSAWRITAVLNYWNGLVTAIATGFIALFTVALSSIGREQARDNRITEQAYVFPLAPQSQFLMRDDQTIWGLRLFVPWKNSGGTPAVPVNSLVGATWVQNETDFEYGTVVQQGQHQPFVLGPGAEIPSGTIDIISPQLNDLFMHHQGHQFFWGWARYKDVFPNSPWHIVEFCFRVIIEGELGPPPFTGRVNFAFYGEHNRYYDEN